jgi:calcineurin-like phosphoesterase family protein
MIDGKKYTVLWHVDDLKISHVREDVYTNIIKRINGEFGKEAPITITRVKVHDCLGMTLEYYEKGKVKIKMLDYVNKMLAHLPAEMYDEAPSPVANHWLTVNDDYTKVDDKKAHLFPTYVAKKLFLCKRAIPDLQTAVAFLSTRVKS